MRSSVLGRPQGTEVSLTTYGECREPGPTSDTSYKRWGRWYVWGSWVGVPSRETVKETVGVAFQMEEHGMGRRDEIKVRPSLFPLT